jgi:hypothetical protein
MIQETTKLSRAGRVRRPSSALIYAIIAVVGLLTTLAFAMHGR